MSLKDTKHNNNRKYPNTPIVPFFGTLLVKRADHPLSKFFILFIVFPLHYLEYFFIIDNLNFELSHSIELSLNRSLSTF